MLSAAAAVMAQELLSPDGNMRMRFSLDQAGMPTYELRYKDKPVICKSRMGFVLRGKGRTAEFSGNVTNETPIKPTESLYDEFELVDTQTSTFDQTWQPVWGEEASIRNHYNELCVTLRQPRSDRRMVIRFRLFDDGLGFRYEFPVQPNLVYFVIIRHGGYPETTTRRSTTTPVRDCRKSAVTWTVR